jgi:phospholipid/cholesterol/gamma-HCH transport system permease protein
VPFLEYFRALLRAIQLRDIFSTILKSFVFGVIVSVVATYQGFKVSSSVTEIPRAAIKAVGQGFVLCFLADALITLIYYL